MFDYLSRFVTDLKIIGPNNLTEQERNLLPLHWLEITNADPADRVSMVLNDWQLLGSDLRNITHYLQDNLQSIDLISCSRGLSMIYGVRTGSDSTVYYEGRPPADKKIVANGRLMKTPAVLQEFYSSLHDGWYYFSSQAMGLMPIERCFALADEDWGILESLPHLSLDLNDCIAVFNNGMGDFLCLDIGHDPARGLVWFHDKAPKVDIDFWDFLDSWLCIGFE